MTVEVHLSASEFSRLPYRSTRISKGRTKGELMGLLEEYGVRDYQWTTLGGEESLAFAMEVELVGVRRRLLFRFTVPRIFVRKRVAAKGGSGFQEVYMEEASWRLFFWHLKGKLEAVRYGLVSVEAELMANIVHRLPDGSESTLGETVRRAIASDRLDAIALEDRRRVVEADVSG